MHKWEKGCEYENCKYKHARPTTTPEGAPATATVTCSATTTRALPTELTLADLLALKEANKPLRVNTTSVYVIRDGFWMQPKVDAQLCSDCGSEHGMMQPCAMHVMHGGHHPLMLTDVRRDIDSIKCRWVPYSVQLAAEGTPALVTATRVGRVQPVASMATNKKFEGGDECKAEPLLLPSRGGYYSPLHRMYTETSDGDYDD